MFSLIFARRLSMDYKYFDEFEYWFKLNGDQTYDVLNKETREVLGKYDPDSVKFIVSSDKDVSKMQEDFIKFCDRPEYVVGHSVKVNGVTAESAQESYESLILGCIMIRAYNAGRNPDKQDDYINRVISWLNTTSFYNDPASTMFHESFKHGLLYHTLRVYNKMVELINIPTFNGVDIQSATLVCLCHDWCKIGLYESFSRNVKNDKTGRWEKVPSYRRGTFPHPLGHGVSSAFMANKMFKLSEEEFAAIRWHMGHYNVSDNEVNEFQQCNEDMPLVHLLQFSDQLSIVNY